MLYYFEGAGVVDGTVVLPLPAVPEDEPSIEPVPAAPGWCWTFTSLS
jgi:hypothetical protein